MFNSRLSMVFALGLLPLVLLGADTREFRDLSPAEQVEVMRSEARVALVIGNGSYDTAPLANPASDARAVAKALRAVGFSVTFEKDLGNLEMKRALSEFGRTLEAGGVGLFYYAGHGIQHDGTNYLVPVDAELKRPDDLEIYGVQADAVLAKMENAGNRVNIVILDACRNDPFSRSSGGGLAMMDARGTFLAYASGAGRVATDEGVYAKALVDHLDTPGAKIEDVFKTVGQEVEDATHNAQSPWVGSNLRGDFFFVLPDEGQASQEPVEVSGSGSAGSSADVVGLAACAAELAKQEAALKEQAASEWSYVEPLLARKDALTKKAVEAWVGKWGPGRAVASACGERSMLRVAQADAAQAWLDAYGDTGGSGGGVVAVGRAGIEWVRIPGGTFQMGSNDGGEDEQPVHSVRVSSFEMSRSEVTVAQYRACVDAGSCDAPTSCGSSPSWGKRGMGEHPVNCVSLDDAQDFARWAGGRLPTEAEWEYAARGDQSFAFAGSSAADEVAWYEKNSDGRTHEVCGKPLNGYGLCDMSGNVWEWVEDAYRSSYVGAPTDGSAWTAGGDSYRVYRGGSWTGSSAYVRITVRRAFSPGSRSSDLGFRLAR